MNILKIIFWVVSMLAINSPVQTNETIQYSTCIEVDGMYDVAMQKAELNGENSQEYYIFNDYTIDDLARSIDGQQGIPICVKKTNASDNEIVSVKNKLTLSLYYNEDELICKEQDLGVLWYNTESTQFEQAKFCEYDYEKNCVTVNVNNLGTYILQDMNMWKAICNGTYGGAMIQPDADWHKVFYYEDVEELADISIYNESMEYHIYTINQLAGLVKLVNEGRNFEGCSFYLENDLDLDGYRWVPVGWYYPANGGYSWVDFPFMGKFYGNGHIIYNMNIIQPQKSDLGMFGRCLRGFSVCDLGLVNCNIEGKFYVGGFVGDIVSNSGDYEIQNCFITGSVKGSIDTGAIVGSAAGVKIKDCYALVNEDSTQVLAADMRGESEELNCHINDDEAKEKLAEYIYDFADDINASDME